MQQVLTEQLDSLFAQTAAGHIKEIWVCVFSAPAKDYAVRVVAEGHYSNVHLVVSDYNFKFYGRFQVRLSFDRRFSFFVFVKLKKKRKKNCDMIKKIIETRICKLRVIVRSRVPLWVWLWVSCVWCV